MSLIETLDQTLGEIFVDVQRLTREQQKAIGLIGSIPHGETRIVAIARGEKGAILGGKIMEDVDQKRFLHGDDNYYFEVLNQAKEIYSFKKNKA